MSSCYICTSHNIDQMKMNLFLLTNHLNKVLIWRYNDFAFWSNVVTFILCHHFCMVEMKQYLLLNSSKSNIAKLGWDGTIFGVFLSFFLYIYLASPIF